VLLQLVVALADKQSGLLLRAPYLANVLQQVR